MPAQRPSDLLKNKTNVHPVINRSTQATAEDFGEAGAILDDHADILDALQNASSADFYGIFVSLAALQAQYPILDDEGFAIITLGVGNPIEIAVYNIPPGEWTIQGQTNQVLLYTNRLAFPAEGQEGIWYIDKAASRGYLWYTAAYNLIGGSVAPNPSKPLKKNFLSLVGVDQDQEHLAIIADAIREHAPWSCSAGQKMEFYTLNVVGTPGNYGYEARHYLLNLNVTVINQPSPDVLIGADDIIPLGIDPPVLLDDDSNPLVAPLGNIGTTDLEDAFNLGKLVGAGPARTAWVVQTILFVTATQNIGGIDTLKRYVFEGGPGQYGGDDYGIDPDILLATEEMFNDITEQSTLPTSENNIITLKKVLDTDLSTIDPDGLADYYNALDPGVMKQGYESWRITVVDSGDVILKTFDLVNRGKGPVGAEAVSANVGNTLTADMFFEINVGVSSGPDIDPDTDIYADVTALIADQGAQEEGEEYYVTDASDFTTITSGGALVLYLGTTVGDETDYLILSNPGASGTGDMAASVYDPANKAEQVLTVGDLLDEDDMASNSATKAPSQQSVKAYVDKRTQYMDFACSNETSNLLVGTGFTMVMMRALPVVTKVDFSVTTAPTGSTIILNVKKNGTTIYSTKPTIDATEFSTLTGTAQVLSGATAYAVGDILSVEIDQVGSTVAGAGLKAMITYNN